MWEWKQRKLTDRSPVKRGAQKGHTYDVHVLGQYFMRLEHDASRNWRKTQTKKRQRATCKYNTRTAITWAIKEDAKIIQWIRFGSIEWTEQMPILWDVNNNVDCAEAGCLVWDATLFAAPTRAMRESKIANKECFHAEKPQSTFLNCIARAATNHR